MWYSACVEPSWSLPVWRDIARAALMARIPPEAIAWSDDTQTDLIGGQDVGRARALRETPRIPAAFLHWAKAIVCHRDPQRHALLYRILWRIVEGERHLLEHLTDPDIVRARGWAQAVQRDVHHMKGFVRFKQLSAHEERYVAWYEPDHCILDRIAPHFARRFTRMDWAILTPYRSVRWNGRTLKFAPGGDPSGVPDEDAQDAAWKVFYASIFNPARVNTDLMRQHMPQRHWKHLPEAQVITGLVRSAGQSTLSMIDAEEDKA